MILFDGDLRLLSGFIIHIVGSHSENVVQHRFFNSVCFTNWFPSFNVCPDIYVFLVYCLTSESVSTECNIIQVKQD